MKEDFLHYLWKFKKFDALNLKTSKNEEIVISHVGQYLQLAGPDFFNAQITIGNQKWAGNVEIHIKSSDWYLHHHEKDSRYENIILHVVWEHDTEIFRNDNTEIPVLELKNYVNPKTIANYRQLVTSKSWINCEKQLKEVPQFLFENWLERLFFERLKRKSEPILSIVSDTNSNWEAVLFCLLAKNFGLNSNGDVFFKMAQSIPFSVIRKESFDLSSLEALFFGMAGLLEADKEDVYYKDLQFRYYYLLHKYQIEKSNFGQVQFFKHRPDNFPTIRLSQLAALYHNQQNLFSKLINLNSLEAIYNLFHVSVSSYWENHFVFDKESPRKRKNITKSFIDLIVLNTVVPLQFAYNQYQDKEVSENLIALLNAIPPENNSVIEKFDSFGINAKNAFETQSLLQLKKEYCDKNKCLDCAVGMQLLKYD